MVGYPGSKEDRKIVHGVIKTKGVSYYELLIRNPPSYVMKVKNEVIRVLYFEHSFDPPKIAVLLYGSPYRTSHVYEVINFHKKLNQGATLVPKMENNAPVLNCGAPKGIIKRE